MARPQQKRKNRSSLPRIKQTATNRKKHHNIKSNAIVAANWNPKETFVQNYRRLGLTAKLGKAAGGVEKDVSTITGGGVGEMPAAVGTTAGVGLKRKRGLDIERSNEAPMSTSETQNGGRRGNIVAGQVKVLRDPETGAIIKVLRSEEEDEQEREREKQKKRNPLGDPLNDIEDESDEEDSAEDEDGIKTIERGIIPQLEGEAARLTAAARAKPPRKQSQREQEWVEALVAKYGRKEEDEEDDFAGMMRDRKLNPMQQSEGELRRRVMLWRNARARERGEEVGLSEV